MADPVVTDTPAPVSGWKTTEFWATVAGALIAILNQAFNWHIPSETITQIVSGIAAYVIGRSVVKAVAPSTTTTTTPSA